MSAKILDGKKVRDEVMIDLKNRISEFKIVPNLAIIKIGDNPDSEIYVKRKIDFAKKIGANAYIVGFPSENISQEMLIEGIEKLNKNANVHGIIVQAPLPTPLDWNEAVEKVAPEKDVDGLCSVNVEKLLNNDTAALIPATAKGVLSLLKYYEISIKDKKVVVMGRSSLVGKPVATLMKNNGADVTVCHSQTIDSDKIAREADILIVAIGKAEYIGADYVKEGQTIVDIGINTVINSDGTRKIYGDVDFESVKEIVGAISPVPGGVGPMTVASLFQNLVESFERQVKA